VTRPILCGLFLLIATPLAAAAADLEPAIARVLPETTEIRHRLHQNPELSNREVETSRLVADRLLALGLEVRTGVAKTGVIATLRGGKPGPVVGVRADMDALPVTEATGLPFRSTRRTEFLGQDVGVAHACGHDIHTSVALGVAAVLAGMRQDLRGTVKFFFQPAEEGPPPGEEGGAALMIREGALDEPRPAAIFALHSFPELSDAVEGTVGKVGWWAGAAFAAVDQFALEIRGKQSHGAAPHLGVDPVVMAAQVVLGLQTIRSRTLSPLEPSVVTVGIVRGGERFNIIPGAVRLEGTVRTYSEAARATVQRRMREIADGITRAGGGSYDLVYTQNAPATHNDAALAAWARPVLEAALGAENVVPSPPTMAGEDFAYFANEVPGFYFRLGVVKPGTASGGLHTPDFRADDGAIAVGIRAMTHLVLAYSNKES
jgi:amidohydrolase